MDPNNIKVMGAAAGAAGADGAKYVEEVFSTYVYEGNSDDNTTGSTQIIPNGIDLDGEGGLVWTKDRDGTRSHHLYSSVMDTINTQLSVDNDGEAADSSFVGMQSFNDNGFTLGPSASVNYNNQGYVSWTFRKAPGFFDVVAYTGDDESSREISHSLGSVPGFITVKAINTDTCTTNPGTWRTYHKSEGATKYLRLDHSIASDTRPEVWDDTTPTSSVFTVGIDNNQDGVNYVAYIFASGVDAACKIFGDNEDQEIIKCGAFASDGSNDGKVVLGWEPQWILAKNSDGPGDWYIFDTIRTLGPEDVTNRQLRADSAAGEADYPYIYITSDGFGWDGASIGDKDWVFVAIRRGPMKTPEDATKVFEPKEYAANNGSDFDLANSLSYTDFVWIKRTASSSDPHVWNDRYRPTKYFATNTDVGEATWNNENITFDRMNSFGVEGHATGYINSGTNNYISYSFKRAKGFFDMVFYHGAASTGDGIQDVPHSLGVQPELMIIKCRSHQKHGMVYHEDFTSTDKFLRLDGQGPEGDDANAWNDQAPSATSFRVGTSDFTNKQGEQFIAYLFASVAGVSKIDHYDGTGNAVEVECGFNPRFVMVRRIDEQDAGGGVAGDWYVWDTIRGINVGGDSHLTLNTDDAEYTGVDYIDPYTAGPGFIITGEAPVALNESGGKYIYLAIA